MVVDLWLWSSTASILVPNDEQCLYNCSAMLDDLLKARKSVRAFLPREIDDEVLRQIFASAQRAPSWCNTQPWHVWVVRGAARAKIIGEMVAASQSSLPNPDIAWPADYPEPYGARRRECGKALYDSMSITREDKAGRAAAWTRNFMAFEAPHVAFVAVPKALGAYGMLDLGIWLQTVLLAAAEHNVATCAQASLATFPDIVRKHLQIPDSLALAVGIAIGYEDTSAPANQCTTTRIELDDSVRFVDGLE